MTNSRFSTAVLLILFLLVRGEELADRERRKAVLDSLKSIEDQPSYNFDLSTSIIKPPLQNFPFLHELSSVQRKQVAVYLFFIMISACPRHDPLCKPQNIRILSELLAKGDPDCIFTCSKEKLMFHLPALLPSALELALNIVPVLQKQLGEPVEIVEEFVRRGQILVLREEDIPNPGQGEDIDWTSMEAIYPLFNMATGLAAATIDNMSREELNATLKKYPDPDFMTSEIIRTIKRERGCFDAESIVRVQVNSSVVSSRKLKDLKLGDHVESIDDTTGGVTFSEVYYIAQSNDIQKVDLRRLHCRDTTFRTYNLGLSARHVIYATKHNQIASNIAIPIRTDELSVNDYLWVKLKYKLIPCQILRIRKYSAEVRHPLTKNHHILVNDVHASVHIISEDLYRWLSTPLRWIYYYLHSSLNDSWLVHKLVELVQSIKEPFMRDEL